MYLYGFSVHVNPLPDEITFESWISLPYEVNIYYSVLVIIPRFSAGLIFPPYIIIRWVKVAYLLKKLKRIGNAIRISFPSGLLACRSMFLEDFSSFSCDSKFAFKFFWISEWVYKLIRIEMLSHAIKSGASLSTKTHIIFFSNQEQNFTLWSWGDGKALSDEHSSSTNWRKGYISIWRGERHFGHIMKHKIIVEKCPKRTEKTTKKWLHYNFNKIYGTSLSNHKNSFFETLF